MTIRKAYSYIRMSTDLQLKGDSLRRQLEASATYAKNNHLELVDSIDGIELKDIGVSAFKGKNTQSGVLSLFLDALDSGKIKPDSILLVESLDRLSRDTLSQALSQFMRILEKGIEIVTLADNQKYTKQIIDKNTTALIISLSIMYRANDESEMKSIRLSAAWKNKRDNATKKIVTRTCPAWLKYSEDNNKFEIVEGRGQVVKSIFDMCINSYGIYSIAKYLNENNIPVFGAGKIWYISYVKKIIMNRSVIGEFQTHHQVDGKRVKTGEPISDYFPKIIDEQTYLLAQVAVGNRKQKGVGRKGKTFSSIFAGITHCGLCGFRMMVRYRGGKTRSARYLICNNSMVNAGCDLSEWNMADFEEMMFRHLRDVDFSKLIVDQDKVVGVPLSDQIDALNEKLRSIQESITAAIDLSITHNRTESIKQRYVEKIEQYGIDEKSAKESINELHKLAEEKAETIKLFNTSELKLLLEKIEEKKDDYMFRASLNQFLMKTIDRIELLESKEPFSPWELDEDDDVIKLFRSSFKVREKRNLDEILQSPEFEKFDKNYNRTIKITYRSGAERILFCGRDSSLSFRSRKKTPV